MEDQYWAKSDGETIIQHTQNLLDNFKLLKELYPEIPVDWELLKTACLYHDLGKINRLFQEKLREKEFKKVGEIPHALLSITLLPVKELKKTYSKTELTALMYAIALHHERNFSDITEENYQNEITELATEAAKFKFNRLNLPQPANIKEISERYYAVNSRLQSSDAAFHEYVILKGLLNKIDYAASGHYQVEYPAKFLEKNLEKMLSVWQQKNPEKKVTWNPMQQYVYEHQEDDLIVIGQTGLGKTEAGLRWVGDHKGFFTLPLKAAINAIYERIVTDIADKEYLQQQVGLLHSDSLAVLLRGNQVTDPENFGQLEGYPNEIRSWSLPLTITTLDQTFNFVYHYAGFEIQLATFAYSKIVIDEIQMYSPDLLAYLIKGLKEIQSYGGKFLIMTATMPQYLIELLEKNGIVFKMNATPFLDEKLLQRHYLRTVPEELSTKSILDRYSGGKLLVVCNTVKKAKTICQELQDSGVGVPINLLHSQFIRQDRQTKEQAIIEFAKSDQTGIWIATQVVEASLDIDFDLLITELSDLNGLFQRMGRCYRKRALKEQKPNVYVFTGGEKTTSGISSSEYAVVHYDIFDLSKTALGNYDGFMSEQGKMDMIAKTYTTENMQTTPFYQQINQMLIWLAAVENDKKSKTEVQKLFRKINTRNVILEKIYQEHREQIDELLAILRGEVAIESQGERRRLKKRARVELENYMLAVQEWLFKKSQKNGQVRISEINDYEQVYFIQGTYDAKTGFEPSKSSEKFDNFI